MSNTICTIYCDGGCRGNPGISGSGVVIYDLDETYYMYGRFNKEGTNNTAELEAFIWALKAAEKKEKSIIYADSKYCINSITKWAFGWKANNWTKSSGPIKNLELIKIAHDIYASISKKVEIKYVKGHSGNLGNDTADALANLAMDSGNNNWILTSEPKI